VTSSAGLDLRVAAATRPIMRWLATASSIKRIDRNWPMPAAPL
jgi:hypothetical protein